MGEQGAEGLDLSCAVAVCQRHAGNQGQHARQGVVAHVGAGGVGADAGAVDLQALCAVGQLKFQSGICSKGITDGLDLGGGQSLDHGLGRIRHHIDFKTALEPHQFRQRFGGGKLRCDMAKETALFNVDNRKVGVRRKGHGCFLLYAIVIRNIAGTAFLVGADDQPHIFGQRHAQIPDALHSPQGSHCRPLVVGSAAAIDFSVQNHRIKGGTDGPVVGHRHNIQMGQNVQLPRLVV